MVQSAKNPLIQGVNIYITSLAQFTQVHVVHLDIHRPLCNIYLHNCITRAL